MRCYLSTIDPQAHILAKEHGLGLEIAEYCTAWNMDEKFPETDKAVREKLNGISGRILHGPFNELFPCAIDPLARELAKKRYRQAITLAQSYGMEKVVLHGGYNPRLYYPVWYTEQSILFWNDFLNEVPETMAIVLENVLEEEPGMILEIVRQVNDPRLKMCLDIGHVNAYSQISVEEWLKICSPFITHFHIHNNSGSWDTHSSLTEGSIPIAKVLHLAQKLCPEATMTLELIDAEASVKWLEEELWNSQ